MNGNSPKFIFACSGKHARVKEKEREHERRKRHREEQDKARREWERQKRREMAREHSRRERYIVLGSEIELPCTWLQRNSSLRKLKFVLNCNVTKDNQLFSRDRLEQLERERERKIREQQKEQREQKERERRAEERRKEREARREGDYWCLNAVWIYCLPRWWNGGRESFFT